MKAKLKLGAGMGRRKHARKGKKRPVNGKGKKKISFQKYKKIIGDELRKAKPRTAKSAIVSAWKSAKAIKLKKNVTVGKVPGMIRVPKTGGVLPLIPIFAALSKTKQ